MHHIEINYTVNSIIQIFQHNTVLQHKLGNFKCQLQGFAVSL